MAETQISCIRLVPYRQFTDGTSGSILVLDWMSDTPSVFLFNSTERLKEAPNSTRNHLLPSEVALYTRYTTDETQGKLPESARERYARYDIVRLAGTLVSAHVADIVCHNINARDTQTQRNTRRVEDKITEAKAQYRSRVLEQELLHHASAAANWERAILAQTLPLLCAGYNHAEWLETTLSVIRTKEGASQEEKGIRAVRDAGICKCKADWGAVFKILVERHKVAKASYLAGATIINRICEEEVTTASAIKQSPALVILGGTAERGWTDKAHNRQSANMLLHYRDIAEIFGKKRPI